MEQGQRTGLHTVAHQMKVLVACESSGVVREAFNAYSGVHAVSCDLQPADDGRSDYHIQGDVLKVLNDGWDLLIGHPPCTYLCASGMHWTTRGLRDHSFTADAIYFAEALWSAPIHRIAIENPIGCLSTNSALGKPTQIIQPFQFGENASKATCLWLKHLPPLAWTKYIRPRIVNGKARFANQTDGGQNRLAPSDVRWKTRSKTYTGIAQAMAAAWTHPEFFIQPKLI